MENKFVTRSLYSLAEKCFSLRESNSFLLQQLDLNNARLRQHYLDAGKTPIGCYYSDNVYIEVGKILIDDEMLSLG